MSGLLSAIPDAEFRSLNGLGMGMQVVNNDVESSSMRLAMDHPVDRFISLTNVNSQMQDETWRVIDWLNQLLSKDPSTIDDLTERLKEYRVQPPEALREIPADIADTILKTIIDILEDEGSIPILIEKLDNWRAGYYVACILLGWFGPRAHEALPALARWIDHSHAGGVAQAAAMRIGGDLWPVIAKELRIFLDAEQDGLSFVNIGGFAVEAGYAALPDFMDILQKAAQNNEVDIRWAVPQIIGWMKPAERKAYLPILRQLENDPSDEVREEVARALSRGRT